MCLCSGYVTKIRSIYITNISFQPFRFYKCTSQYYFKPEINVLIKVANGRVIESIFDLIKSFFHSLPVPLSFSDSVSVSHWAKWIHTWKTCECECGSSSSYGWIRIANPLCNLSRYTVDKILLYTDFTHFRQKRWANCNLEMLKPNRNAIYVSVTFCETNNFYLIFLHF